MSSTTTVSGIPPWMEDYTKSIMASGEQLIEKPYQPYEGAELAGFNTNQLDAFNMVKGNMGMGQEALSNAMNVSGDSGKSGINQVQAGAGLFNQGVGMTNEAAMASRNAPGTFNAMLPGLSGMYKGTAQAYNPTSVNNFMNPYTAAVTEQGLDEIRRQGKKDLNQISANAAAGGAFGGARHGIAEAEQRRNMLNTQSQFINQSNAQNYGQAQNASMQDFQNQMSRQAGAAQGIGGLGQTSSQLQANTASQLGALGGQYGQLGTRYGQAGQQISDIGNRMAMTQAELARVGRGFAGDDIAAMQNMGNTQQVQAQRGLDLDKNRWQQQQQHPYEQLNYMSGLLKGTPYRSRDMSVTEGDQPSTANQLIGGLATLAGAGKEFGWWGK